MAISAATQRVLTNLGFKALDIVLASWQVPSETNSPETRRLEARQRALDQILATQAGQSSTTTATDPSFIQGTHAPAQVSSSAASAALTPEPGSQDLVRGRQTPIPGATDLQTLKYQLDHLRDPLRQLELHLAEGCQITPGVGCDCCNKHLRDLETFAQETIPIAARQGKDPSVFAEMVEWARRLEPVTTVEASSSGRHKALYMRESGAASNFRKKVEAMTSECQPCKAAAAARQAKLRSKAEGLARRVQAGETTIDQAKEETKALVAEVPEVQK